MAKPQSLPGAAGDVPAVVGQTLDRLAGAPVLSIKRRGELGGRQLELGRTSEGWEGVRRLLGTHGPATPIDAEITILRRGSDRAIAAMGTCGELNEAWIRALEEALAPTSTERPQAGSLTT